jgi:alpha-L-fucosidase
MGISCYFSKPDWHHDDYWHGGATGRRTTRMPSYDIKAFPGKWKNFAGFTRNQILELIGSYGPIDILWLDGGWISERHGRGIGIPSVIAEARKINPGLIAVDRRSGGVCEDITTPEQTVPETGPAMPWESCITIGTAFSYRYDDVYKSGRELIHLLLDVVAKGGNLALNVAPAPNGEFPRAALDRLEYDELGAQHVYAGAFARQPHAPQPQHRQFVSGSLVQPILHIRPHRTLKRFYVPLGHNKESPHVSAKKLDANGISI